MLCARSSLQLLVEFNSYQAMRQKLVREMPPANSMRRRAYYLPLVALAAGCLLFGSARCIKQHRRDAETFTVE